MMWKDRTKLRKSLRKILGIEEKNAEFKKYRTYSNAKNGVGIIQDTQTHEMRICLPKTIWNATDLNGYTEKNAVDAFNRGEKIKTVKGIVTTEIMDALHTDLWEYGLTAGLSKVVINFLPSEKYDLTSQENKQDRAYFPTPPALDSSLWGNYTASYISCFDKDFIENAEFSSPAEALDAVLANYGVSDNWGNGWLHPHREATVLSEPVSDKPMINECFFDYSGARYSPPAVGNEKIGSVNATNADLALFYNNMAELHNDWYSANIGIGNTDDDLFRLWRRIVPKSKFVAFKEYWQSKVGMQVMNYATSSAGKIAGIELGVYQQWIDGEPMDCAVSVLNNTAFIGVVITQPTVSQVWLHNGSIVKFWINDPIYDDKNNVVGYRIGGTTQQPLEIAKCSCGMSSHWCYEMPVSGGLFFKTSDAVFNLVCDDRDIYKFQYFHDGRLLGEFDTITFQSCPFRVDGISEMKAYRLTVDNAECEIVFEEENGGAFTKKAVFNFQGEVIENA